MSLRSTLNDQCKSAKQEPNLSRPDNSECICGCRGRPLGSFKFEAEKFSYENYKICPARLNRKAKERYQKTKHRAAGRAQRKATRFAELQKEKAALKKEKAKGKVKEKRDWERRKLNNLAPESRKEAAFRGYKTYIGNPCKRGHNGERETRSGQCIHCRESDRILRGAMKRALYPESLSEKEKESILLIYKKAKQRSKKSGIQYHVDHIKPLSKGGSTILIIYRLLLLMKTSKRELNGTKKLM